VTIENETAARSRLVAATFAEASRLHECMRDLDPAPILAAVDAIRAALTAGGKVLVFGNGGSASDAQHFTAELVGRFGRKRQALAAIALTADTSVVTAVSNDFGFEQLFARQIEALGRREDAVLGISTSGCSPNVTHAFATAAALGIKSISLTGANGGPVANAARISVIVPSDETPRIQELHRTILHIICDLIEREIAPS
jgi:D-sedoheptulose 7-phosphate isomerase